MKSTTIARIRQIRQSLFARFVGVQSPVENVLVRARKSAAVRQLYRILNKDSKLWVHTQVVADRSSSVFARLRRGLSRRVSALTIRNPFSQERLRRSKIGRRAWQASFAGTFEVGVEWLERREMLAVTVTPQNLSSFRIGPDFLFRDTESISVSAGLIIDAKGGKISFEAPVISIGVGAKHGLRVN